VYACLHWLHPPKNEIPPILEELVLRMGGVTAFELLEHISVAGKVALGKLPKRKKLTKQANRIIRARGYAWGSPIVAPYQKAVQTDYGP
jgi:hypothetical protein